MRGDRLTVEVKRRARKARAQTDKVREAILGSFVQDTREHEWMSPLIEIYIFWAQEPWCMPLIRMGCCLRDNVGTTGIIPASCGPRTFSSNK
jgi:hypothetical protein